MALSNTGITTTIVKTTIGAASNNIGQICTHSNINKWSKYKPVRYANVAPERGAGSVWWRAQDGNCGLNIPNYSDMAAMFTALRNNTVMWDYLKPSGGASQPFRLGDFGGYEHSAQPPFIPMNLADVYYASNGTMGCALDLSVPSEYELTINDIGYTWNLGEMYFGVAICKQGTSGYKYMTENITISAGGGGGIDVPISSELGTYEVVYFLAETAKTSFTSPDRANTFIPIPNAMQVVNIQASDFGVYFGGGTYWDAGKTYFEIIFDNMSSGPKTLNKCYINIKYGDNIDGPGQVGEVGFEIHTNGQPDGIVYAPANTETIISVDYPVSGVSNPVLGALTDFDTRGGYIKFTNLTNGDYNTGSEIGAME